MSLSFIPLSTQLWNFKLLDRINVPVRFRILVEGEPTTSSKTIRLTKGVSTSDRATFFITSAKEFSPYINLDASVWQERENWLVMVEDTENDPPIYQGFKVAIQEEGTYTLNVWLGSGGWIKPKGNGILSGSFPLSLLTEENNVPSDSVIRILYRPEGMEKEDGLLVDSTVCNADGTWQIHGLDENSKFDIVARIPGYNDVLISDVRPTGAPLTAHFAGIQEEYEYKEEVSIQVVALGGRPPYSYTVNTLPEGLTFDSDTGYITGSMPAGDLMISVTVTDAVNDSVTITWEGTVDNPLPTTIGEPFGGGFYAGDIEYSDGHWYKLIVADKSADIAGANARWKTTPTATVGTDSLTDGVANTAAMVAAGISQHPAANHCISHSGGGFEDWYMPALDELSVIYQNLGLDRPNCPPDFKSGGPQAFSNTWYWASTEFAYDYSRVQNFSNGSISQYGKTNTTPRVRPIRRIPFTP